MANDPYDTHHGNDVDEPSSPDDDARRLQRWREIEAWVDGEADAESSAVRPSVLDRLDAEAAGPLDHPLDQRLGDLVQQVVTSQGRLGIEIGDTVGSYAIEGVLGEGGMGTVFLARRSDGSFEQQVALKVLHRSRADETSRRRFLQERQILAGLKHPHIARLLDGGVVQQAPYLVMEYIEGPLITEYCRQRSFGPEACVRLLLQACDAVRYAHREGVIHRDLKPSNLLVEEGTRGAARVAVLDFGIALVEDAEVQVTATGQIFGTPGYMSPEQASGQRAQVDRRTDVYALGVLLYEMFSGRRPFEGANPSAILQQLLHEEPTPLSHHLPSLSVDLRTIVMTCLERQPERRYDSVRALAADLENYLDGRSIAARPISWAARWLRRARQRPQMAALVLGAATVTLASLIVLVGMAWRHTRDLEVERQAAIVARRDAEGLLEFMLDDLHQGLDRAGRLDLLEKVAKESLSYYARRPSGGSVDENVGRAEALFNAGAVLEEQGEYQQALEAYGQNQFFFEELVQQDPDPRWRLRLARSLQALAGAHNATGDAHPASQLAQDAVAICRELAALEDPPEGLQEVFFESLSLAGWISMEAVEVPEAIALLGEAVQLAARQAEETQENAWHHQHAVALSYLGMVYYQEGDLETALVSFEPARRLCEHLVELEPSNSAWREELQLVLGRLGAAYLDLDDLPRAALELDAARRQAEVLVQLEPGNTNWLRELGVTHATLAATWQAKGDLVAALASIESSLEVSRTLLEQFPDNPSMANDLAWDLFDLGQIRSGLGRHVASREAFDEALQKIRDARQRSPESLYFLDTEFQIVVAMGHLDEARALARNLHAEGWKSPDFIALCDEHGLLP